MMRWRGKKGFLHTFGTGFHCNNGCIQDLSVFFHPGKSCNGYFLMQHYARYQPGYTTPYALPSRPRSQL